MTSLFDCGLRSVLRDDALYVQDGATEKKISTQRSAMREFRMLAGIAAPGKKVLYVAPFAPWHEIPQNVVWLNPFGTIVESRSNLIQSVDQWRQFLFSLTGDEKFILEVNLALPRREYLTDLLQRDLQRAAARLKTIRHFEILWPWNFQRNRRAWLATEDWRHCAIARPDAIVLGGPQADAALDQMPASARLWCADTALPALIGRGLVPSLVASIDAGFASMEHFVGVKLPRETNHPPLLLLDALSVPALYRRDGWKKISYRSSHPLVQQEPSQHGELFNATGDVRGILEALYRALFPGQELCIVLGGEGSHLRGMSHLRGSAYLKRHLGLTNRFFRFEEYSRLLSRRYVRVKDK